jgi:hypothetical protein
MATTFYPALNSVIDLDVLPEQLSFVKNGANDLLSKLFFKDLEYTRNARGDVGHYSLKLVSLTRIDVGVPGTGFALVLNPSVSAPGDPTQFISEFPVTIDWEWPILAYIHAFKTEGFSFDGGAFYELGVQVFNLPGDRLVEEALKVFFPGPSDEAATRLVDAINAHPSYDAVPHATGANPALEIANAIVTVTGQTPAHVIFDVFVFDANDDSVSLEKVGILFGRVLGGNALDHLKKLLIPKIDATLGLSAAIEFPRDVFVPLDASGNPDPDPNAKSMLVFSTAGATLQFSTEKGFGYSDELEATLTPSQIGNTGLKITIEKAKLDLSRERNIPEADEDGRPQDFIGVFITKATITLPPFLNQDDANSSAEIYAERLLAGTGGISGTIGLRAKNANDPAPALVKASLGGKFELSLSGFDLTLQQNRVTGSNIRGSLKVADFKDTEGNDALIEITAHFDANGDFSVVASEQQGIRALRIPDVLDVIVKSVALGRTGGRFFLAVAGELDFAEQDDPIGRFVPDKIEVQKLIIWDDGKFEFEGGKLTLPQAISLSIGPVKLSVTALGFGSHQQEHAGVMRDYGYFTFDGGVNVNPGGVDVSGKGIAFYYTTDNNDLPSSDPNARPLDVFMRIQSIAVDIILPGNADAKNAAVILKGFLAMQQPTPPAVGTEYAGGIDLALPRLKMAGSAAMRLNPSVPAFIVDAGLEMAKPILLGGTGLGIYGFRGLLGMRYVASRQQIGLTENDPWWQYYKKKVAPDFKEGIQVSKFAQAPGFSLGAGVSLATSFDAGVTFSSKLFFLLSLPEVFLLQGQAQLLKKRIGLDTTQDPPYFALISISNVSIETAFGVNYKVPDEGNNQGKIAKLDGVLEMGYFFANSKAWYLNIGRDTPEERRIKTRLLTVFDVYFYLMVSHSGIRAGAGSAYSLKKKWGPLKAELSAYLDVTGQISRSPKQIGASIQVGGTVEVSIFGCGFGLSGNASLTGEGIRPFIVAGSLKVCVKILWKKYCGTFDFNWTFDPLLNLIELLIMLEDLAKAGKALNMHTGETFNLWTSTALPSPAALEGVMLPMDSYIDLEFAKSVKIASSVAAKFGGSLQGSKFIEYFPPQRAKSDRVRHEYSLESIEILYHDGSNWVPYDMYAAATPLALAPFITADLTTLPYGYWQNEEPGEQRKLRIMAPSPLNYLSQGTGQVVPEDLGITVEEIFCAPERKEEICLVLDGFRPADAVPIVLERNRFYFYQLFRFRVTGGDGAVVQRPAGTFKRAVQSQANEAIEIYFIEAYPRVTLHMRVCSETAVVSYYERVLAPMPAGYKDIPLYMYRLISSKVLDADDDVVTVDYEDLHRPVDKVVIANGPCQKRDPPQCQPDRVYPTLLLRFVRTLIRNKHLCGPVVELSAEFFETYKGIFFETPLYGNPNRPHTRYTVTSRNPAQLNAEITDDAGFRCRLELSADPAVGGLDWAAVTDLASLLSLPDSADLYLFTAELTALVGGNVQSVRVTGHSCYPMLDCKDSRPPGGLGHLGTFLTELASMGALERPLTTLSGDHTKTFAQMLGVTDATTSVRIMSATGTGEWHIAMAPDQRMQSALTIRPQEKGAVDRLSRIREIRDVRLINASDEEVVLKADAVLQSEAEDQFHRGIQRRAETGEQTAAIEITISGELARRNRGATAAAAATVPRRCGECETLLYSVCVTRYIDAVQNENQGTQTQVTEEVQTMINAFNGSIQLIWRPYTNYAIVARTQDTLYRENSNSVEQAHPVRTQVFAFRTTGPLGHFHSYIGPGDAQIERADYQALKLKDRQNEFKLKDFLHYVDFAKSYPNADGQLLNAKPLFYRAPRIQLFFLKPYVYEMVRGWSDLPGSDGTDMKLTVTVKEPAPDPSTPPQNATELTWEISPYPIISQEVKVINNMITYGEPCANVTVINPLAVYSSAELPDLRPLKMYTAIFNVSLNRNSAPDASTVLREVLRYPFQTSRYADFDEQINSWRLKTNGALVERAAVFTLDFTAKQDAAQLAVATIADTLPPDHSLRKDFGDPFDRLMNGVLQITGLHPAATTEFNVVHETSTGRIFGILVRNPEPFNDPKMPEAVLAGTLTASINGSAASAWKVLWSKDRAQGFLTNSDSSANVPPAASAVFTFVYRQWDGGNYSAVATVATSAIALP